MGTRDYYNRYNNFIVNGQQTVVPYIGLPSKSTDKRYIFKVAQSRLDKVSQQHYNSPFFGWLILQANPEFTGFEFNIPDGEGCRSHFHPRPQSCPGSSTPAYVKT